MIAYHRAPDVHTPLRPDARCSGCARVVDELDGVQTGPVFECGPCFISREATHGVDRERNEP